MNRHVRFSARCFRACVLLLPFLTLFFSGRASAQTFGSATGLLQGERIARVTTLYNGVLKAATDTTAWLAFGTHDAALAGERPFAPTRFTLFAKVDTAGVAHAAVPNITLRAEIALSDTTVPYSQRDGSLDVIPSTDPLTVTTGQSLPVPVYGGGYLRLIVTSADSARIRLDLWRVR